MSNNGLHLRRGRKATPAHVSIDGPEAKPTEPDETYRADGAALFELLQSAIPSGTYADLFRRMRAAAAQAKRLDRESERRRAG